MSQRRLIALEGQFPAFLAASIMPVLLLPLANEAGPFPQPLVAPIVFDLLILQSVRTLLVLQPTVRGRCIGALYTVARARHRAAPLGSFPVSGMAGWPPAGDHTAAGGDFLHYHLRAAGEASGTRVPRVNMSVLAGAAGGYVRLGLTGGMVATALEVVHPGSFLLGAVGSHEALRDRLLYYSFVTVASLGYGDVLPGNPVGERFAILLSLSSTLYVSLLVALLLGRFIAYEEAELEEEWQALKGLGELDRLPPDDQ